MIRLLQQNNSAVKFFFGVIIVAALGTMVITLVPGIFDLGTSGTRRHLRDGPQSGLDGPL